MKYNGRNRKFFADLDGFVYDFAGARDALGMTSLEFKMMRGSYENLKPYPGAVEGLQTLVNWGWDVWIATKIPDDNPYAATEKLIAINRDIPFLRKSVIITPNKGTLGNKMDFLADDRPHKAHCDEFQGTLLTYGFDNEYKTWDEILAKMAKHCPDGDVIDEIEVSGIFVPVRMGLGDLPLVRLRELPEQHRKPFANLLSAITGQSVAADDPTVNASPIELQMYLSMGSRPQ